MNQAHISFTAWLWRSHLQNIHDCGCTNSSSTV